MPATGTAWLWGVGSGWCLIVLPPEVTFHIHQMRGYYCNPTHFIKSTTELFRKVFDTISISGNLACFLCTWRIPHHKCTILSISIYFKTTRPQAIVASLEAPVESDILVWLAWIGKNDCNEDKNIERRIAHILVSWPNPKQWIIVHISDLIMIIRQSLYSLKHH